MRRTSLLPADVVGAGEKIVDALGRLGHRIVSCDLLEAFCTGAERPLPVDQVIRVLVKRGCAVFFFSTRSGAYRELVEAGRAPHFAMLEAALAGRTWSPPAPPVPPAPEPVVAPAPQLVRIPLDREGHPDLDGRDRFKAIRRAAEDRRGRSTR